MAHPISERTQRTRCLLQGLSDYFSKQSREITEHALFENELSEEDKINIAPNGKPYRTYSQSEMLEELNLKRGSKVAGRLAEKLGLDPSNSPYGGQWTVNLLERNKILQAYGQFLPFERTPTQELAIMIASNLKGGSGKTSLVTLASTGLAIKASNMLRIGVIDLDSQGTCTRILLPKLKVDDPTADYTSVGDLIISDRIEVEEEEEFSSIVRSAFLETNYPNLKVLPAHANDWHFELQSQLEGMTKKNHTSYQPLQRIIDEVREEFDVIFLDTPPALNEVSIGAHFVATHVLIPLRASENDRDSTGKYLSGFNRIYRVMAEHGHPGYHDIKLVPSAIDKRSKTETDFELSYTVGLTGHMTASIPANEAIKNTNEGLNTLFDISPSCYAGANKTCAAAQISLLPFIKSVEAMLASFWKTGVTIDEI